jgi:hypothetical protein
MVFWLYARVWRGILGGDFTKRLAMFLLIKG